MFLIIWTNPIKNKEIKVKLQLKLKQNVQEKKLQLSAL